MEERNNIDSPILIPIKLQEGRSAEQNPSKRSMKEIEEETDKYFLGYMEEYKKKQLEIEPSLKKIPRFFQKNSLNENYNLIYSKVRQEARTRFLHHKTSEI